MSIAGEWWNELLSKMELEVDPKHPRHVTGRYHTNVGNAQQRTYPLVGRCDAAGLAEQLVAWVVVWDPPDPPDDPKKPPAKPSITAWAGQYHVDDETGIEFITTTWLLTHITTAGDDWKSTNVSMDFFFRVRPTPEMVATAKRLGKAASYLSEPVTKL